MARVVCLLPLILLVGCGKPPQGQPTPPQPQPQVKEQPTAPQPQPMSRGEWEKERAELLAELKVLHGEAGREASKRRIHPPNPEDPGRWQQTPEALALKEKIAAVKGRIRQLEANKPPPKKED